MIKIFRMFCRAIGLVLSVVWPPVAEKLWHSVLTNVYTGWLKRRFASLGSDTVVSYRALNLRGLRHVHVGAGTMIGANVQLTAWQGDYGAPLIRIGNKCTIRDFAHITAVRSIIIGDNLLTGTNVLISDNSHGGFSSEHLNMPPHCRPVCSKGGVVIGDNVWLGDNVCVLAGVTIGNGVVVGANSVVTHDIPDFSLAAGCPAKVVKRIPCQG